MRTPTGLVAVALTVLSAGCSGRAGDAVESTIAPVTAAGSRTSTTPVDSTTGTPPSSAVLLYRLDGELHVDGASIDVGAAGPARWRPGHATQVTYGVHASERAAGVFFFEQVRLRDIESGEDRLLLDIAHHGWHEAGHFDWDPTGSRLVFAARDHGGSFRPHVLDVATGEVTRVPTDVQIIDTVFADEGRILGIDTSGAARRSETLAWVGLDGTVTAIAPGEGVNRDPAASPDMRQVANIRATDPLSRVGLGRWDLVITDLATGEERTVGDGEDGFGPPRWISDEILVAKHARYDSAGIVASLPDVVLVDVATGEIAVVEGRTAAWDPDPRR